jgi:hypothetical protein
MLNNNRYPLSPHPAVTATHRAYSMCDSGVSPIEVLHNDEK